MTVDQQLFCFVSIILPLLSFFLGGILVLIAATWQGYFWQREAKQNTCTSVNAELNSCTWIGGQR